MNTFEKVLRTAMVVLAGSAAGAEEADRATIHNRSRVVWQIWHSGQVDEGRLFYFEVVKGIPSAAQELPQGSVLLLDPGSIIQLQAESREAGHSMTIAFRRDVPLMFTNNLFRAQLRNASGPQPRTAEWRPENTYPEPYVQAQGPRLLRLVNPRHVGKHKLGPGIQAALAKLSAAGMPAADSSGSLPGL